MKFDCIVVPNSLLKYKLLMGSDFFVVVKLVRVRGECTIIPVSDDEKRKDIPEIFHIQTIESGNQSEVDISEICKSERIRSLVDVYEPKKYRNR